MSAGEHTVYSASVETPTGVVFTTAVIVPEGAAYADQHDVATELAQMGVSHMLGVDDLSARRTHGARAVEEPVLCGQEGPARTLGGDYVRCTVRLEQGEHEGPCRDGAGLAWIFDPWLKPEPGKVILLETNLPRSD